MNSVCTYVLFGMALCSCQMEERIQLCDTKHPPDPIRCCLSAYFWYAETT